MTKKTCEVTMTRKRRRRRRRKVYRVHKNSVSERRKEKDEFYPFLIEKEIYMIIIILIMIIESL